MTVLRLGIASPDEKQWHHVGWQSPLARTRQYSKDHVFVKGLVASVVFDHNDTNLMDEVVEALKGMRFVGAFRDISKDEMVGFICHLCD